MNDREIGVGLLGFGTVGAGVVDSLLKNRELILKRTGLNLALKTVADLDVDTDRGVAVDRAILTTDADSVIDRDDVGIVIELIGGSGIARNLIEKALKAGKTVVTANKALLAEHGAELFDLAAAHGTDIFFEASVGGGIPIVRSLRDGLVSNSIRSIYGILNGTCNYILTRMEKEHLPFDTVLEQAQEQGFAEADPGLDIDGVDTAHKAAILASLAYGFNVPMGSFDVRGIRGLDKNDIEYASDLGYRIKMLAAISNGSDEIGIQVGPVLVPMDHIMASVDGVFNAVMINGDGVGDVLEYGRGAGRDPTASAVVSDVVDAGRNIAAGCVRRAPGFVKYASDCSLRSPGDATVRCYLRLMLQDKPGVFGKIAAVLGEHDVSIASLLQKEARAGEYVAVVIITHDATYRNVSAALEEIDGLSIVGAPTVVFRIEDFS